MTTSHRRPFALAMLAAAIALAGCGDKTPRQRTRKAAKTEEGTAGKTDADPGGKKVATEGWGHLKGRFVVEGAVPKPSEIVISQDADYCTAFKQSGKLRNESIDVGPNNALKNVVVYLRQKPSRVHDDYKNAEKEVVLDNRECRFEPHVRTLLTTQTLLIKNSDPKQHNTKFDSFKNSTFNEIIPPSGSVTKTLPVQEDVPMPCGCNVHPWMRAYLLIRDSPYMAVTGDDGSFEIKNLPAGEWEFQFWHESSGYLDIGNWRSGRAKLTIEPGKPNDLGELKVPVSKLKS